MLSAKREKCEINSQIKPEKNMKFFFVCIMFFYYTQPEGTAGEGERQNGVDW
jgi:hypothetical protein